jgi:hypothetical protein
MDILEVGFSCFTITNTLLQTYNLTQAHTHTQAQAQAHTYFQAV